MKTLLKDVPVNEFCAISLPPTKDNTFLRPGKGNGSFVPLYDCIGCPIFAYNLDAEVFLIDRDEGIKLFSS